MKKLSAMDNNRGDECIVQMLHNLERLYKIVRVEHSHDISPHAVQKCEHLNISNTSV